VRLERLTNELLDFVKSGELRRQEMDAAGVLRAAIASTGASAIDATFPDHPVTASLDSERLQQALENVLRNALQASPPEGRVQASVRESAGEVTFTVRDFGRGITPGEEARIFEPFVTGRPQGVGLGLAITRRIVEQHGGRLSARNAPDGGAEFTLRLPRSPTTNGG
jgi:two-component system sensor histidine kinase HydH